MTKPPARGGGRQEEIAHLRAERDALRAEVEGLRRRALGGWWRRASAALLAGLACVVLAAGVVGTWARRNFLDTDRFVERAGPLIEQPAVQGELATRLTEEVVKLVDPEDLFEQALPERGRILAGPLASAVEDFVRDEVESFLATQEFEELWQRALAVAHGTAVRVLRDESDVVTTGDGEVTLNLVPIINAVLAQVTKASPEIFGRTVDLPDVTVDEVPKDAIARLEDALGVDLGDDYGQITVYDDGKLAAAQEAVKLVDLLVVVLVPLGVVLAALALWVSHRRRRTLLQLTAGLALGMVLVRQVAFEVRDDLASLVPRSEDQTAVRLTAEAFLDPLTSFGASVLVASAVVAAIAVATADHPWMVSLRRRTAVLWTQVVAATGERARDEATVVWVHEHRDQLLIEGVGFGLVVLWVADLSWFGLLVVVALVAGFVGAVRRISGEVAPAPKPRGPAAASPKSRRSATASPKSRRSGARPRPARPARSRQPKPST